MIDIVKKSIEASIDAKNRLLGDKEELEKIVRVSETIINAIANGRKVLICGNGGSAADAQHFAAELVNRFYLDRRPLPCIALTTDTSILTSIANDFGYEQIYEKQVEALGDEGDILIGISTSGNSQNIVNALKYAKESNIKTIGLLGSNDGKMTALCDFPIKVDSEDTPRIQEVHELILHIIAELVERSVADNERV